MMYMCKILTDEFLAKVEDYITASAEKFSEEKKEEEKERMRRSIYYMWNNPSSIVDHPSIKEHFQNVGLFEPEYTTMPILAKGRFHFKPLITWRHEIKNIADIKEIFSYEEVK